MKRTYRELVSLQSYEERFKYAMVGGAVGEMTFGGHRMMNQSFYRSSEWRRLRDRIIVRDNGCDLAVPGFQIPGKIVIHHLNPIMIEDMEDLGALMNPEYLVCVSHDTHNALHYGNLESIPKPYTPRFQNDTCPWKTP